MGERENEREREMSIHPQGLLGFILSGQWKATPDEKLEKLLDEIKL